MFLVEKTMPNGALGRYHKAAKMEARPDGIYAMVNSYHTAEMDIISWQDTYIIPPPFVVESLAHVEAVLCLPGAPFEGGTVVPDEDATLETAQARKWAEVKARKSALEQTGVAPTPFGTVQCDDNSKIKISGLVQMAQIALAGGQPFGITFTLADNATVDLDAGQMIQLGMAVGVHVTALHDHAQALRAAIFAENQTIEGVNAIDTAAGWP